MKSRIFKFKLDTDPIYNDMDNFLFNIVSNRTDTQIYLSKGRVALLSLNIDDIIFIQSNGYITHYMKCKKMGPIVYNDTIQISVKEIEKFNIPIKSQYKGQGYNILDENMTKELLINN